MERRSVGFQRDARARPVALLEAKGQSALEFALLLPFLLALTFGVIDLGLGIYSSNVVARISRDAVRYLALNPTATDQQVLAAATTGVAGISTAPTVLTIVTSPADPASRRSGTRIAVTIRYAFYPIVPIGTMVRLLSPGSQAPPGNYFPVTAASASYVE